MHFIGRLIGADAVQRHIAMLVGLIVQNRMALRECAAAGILPRQAHMRSFDQQGAKSQSLGRRPIDAFAAFHHLALGIKLLGDFRIDVETFRHAREAVADFLQRRGSTPVLPLRSSPEATSSPCQRPSSQSALLGL